MPPIPDRETMLADLLKRVPALTRERAIEELEAVGLWSTPADVYFEDQPGRHAEVPARDEARRIAANRAKLPDLVVAVPTDGKSAFRRSRRCWQGSRI